MNKQTKFFLLLVAGFFLFSPIAFAAYDWTETQPAGDINKNWTLVNIDGGALNLIAAVTGGRIYLSTDGGSTWDETQPAGDVDKNWKFVSGDGTHLFAGVYGGRLYVSDDGGNSWNETQPAGDGDMNWNAIAASDDMSAIIAGINNGRLYLSTDSGSTWDEIQPDGNTNAYWYSAASDADGSTLIVGGQSLSAAGFVYVSTNGGSTWTRVLNGSGSGQAVASDADGSVLVAQTSRMYISTDSGTTWTLNNYAPTSAYKLAVDADGSTIFSVPSYGRLRASYDGGVTWNEERPASDADMSWGEVGLSADGSKAITGVSSSGRLYLGEFVSPTAPTVTTTSSSTLTSTIVIMYGSIDDTGGEVNAARGFQYGLTTSYGATSTESGGGGFGAGTFARVVGSLTCGTTYHFRAFAANSAETAYGDDATARTDRCGASDPVLYGIDGSGSNSDAPQLYTLDPATGEKLTTIGEVGYYVTGTAFHPETGLLYGSTGGSGGVTKSLITISTSTGAGTLRGTIKNGGGTSLTMPDISFRSDGTLYGWSGQDLYTIDITSCDGGGDTNCLATKIGAAGVGGSGNGLAFDSTDRLFQFGNGDDSYFEINPDTGDDISETQFANPSGNSYSIAAATFSANDSLFASRLNFGDPEADLILIDLESDTIISTGAANPDMQYMDALAFYLPPIQPDTTDPVITILGDNPAEITVGETYSDVGATAEDDIDGDITGDITSTSTVDTTTVGSYTVVYEVSDSSENTAYATRTVEVVAAPAEEGDDDEQDENPDSSHRHSGGGGDRGGSDSTGNSSGITGSVQLAEVITRLRALLVELRARGVNIPPEAAPYLLPAVTQGYTRDLTIGSQGSDVTKLQLYLIAQNKGPASEALAIAGATGYFGPLTKAALAEFQSKVGIAPAEGYFGAKTRAYLESQS
jgi:photosystem II stability/assembly factor-like uncharacterized protein